jgi:hypothetical protein
VVKTEPVPPLPVAESFDDYLGGILSSDGFEEMEAEYL